MAECIAYTPKLGIFNGTWTVESPKGGHRTFRISTQPKEAKFAGGQRLVSILIGAENTKDYKTVAFVRRDGLGFNMFRKQQDTDFEKMVTMLFALAIHGESSVLYGKGYRLLGSGTCVRCNRSLTTPESIRQGIGPVCVNK